LAAPGLSVVTFLTLVSGQIDIAGQALLGSGIYAVWCLWDAHPGGWFLRKFWTASVTLILGWGLGFMLAAPHLLPLLEYAQSGSRMAHRSEGAEERPPVGLAALPQVVLPDIYGKPGRGTKKTPVFGMVERGGNIQRRVVANVSGKTLKGAIRECVEKSATIMTDEWPAYRGIGRDFNGGHRFVNHGIKQYADGVVSTNTAESSFAILKRGITGIYHAVSKKHLHRYVGEFDFRWNTRRMNDGDRTVLAVQGANGKRLDYKTFTQQ
jgi:transposase-like protein